jgi:hypothetical protein
MPVQNRYSHTTWRSFYIPDECLWFVRIVCDQTFEMQYTN